ncbi:MAG: type II toxin-antitoxin system RelE/ParE family toxin [Chloroflexi bacterium]|nr:type II toxin-antitoxin system RelE/ParE family toxin [Chloroflexota bacterium]
MYQLNLDGRAQKDLDRLHGKTLRRVLEALTARRENPRPPGCLKLRGAEDAYRLRVGDYRVLYSVDDGAQTIMVWRVRHRREAYRE